ncbi:TAXI family TRAP transporter solute-binding subunit [Actinokineospora sp. HUAS TT18]|uniref:TAXI family TRAP transporter solute-binding subunit n=1 Tax=Actinokineospora sp. HUAS TT18 TaxID=3447451 RepID=UPI003F525E60
MRRRTFLLGALALTACGAPQVSGDLAVAAGERGGLYLDFAELLANNAPPGLRLTAVPTEGSLDNLERLRARRVDLALVLSDTVATDLVALGRVYENYLQLVVRADSPVRSVADLAGRVVSLGAEGSGAAFVGARLDLGAQVRHLPLADATAALVAGEIDALLWSGGVPTPRLAELPGIRLIPLDEVRARLRAAHGPVYDLVTVPAGVYGADAEVPTVGVANLLVSRPDLADDLAGAVVRLLTERAARLVPEQALGTQFLDARSLIATEPLPLHPGAAAAYRDLHG